MRKINAYTLIEVAVAMLLSALIITICYTAYDIINSYFNVFREKEAESTEVLGLKHILDKDVIGSRCIIKTENGFKCVLDSSAIMYKFHENFVVREADRELHVDTFKLKTTLPIVYFESNGVNLLDTIDELEFKIILANKLAIPISVVKLYSAKDLIH